MKTPLLPGETPVKDGAANLQRGLETVGGRLYLTNQRGRLARASFTTRPLGNGS